MSTTKTTEPKFSYRFKSGISLTDVTLTQLELISKSLGEPVDPSQIPVAAVPRGYYHSGSKGILKISEMETSHLRNALLKYSREFYTSSAPRWQGIDDANFLVQYQALAESTVVQDLFTEISKRAASAVKSSTTGTKSK